MHYGRSDFTILFAILGTFMFASPVALGRLVASDPLVAIDQESTNLYAVSTSDASLTLIGTTGIDGFGALEFNEDDGFLYGITTGASSSLYRISLTDGSAAMVGALGITTFEGGLAFAPDGTAFGVNGGSTAAPVLFEIDLATGEAMPIAAFDDRRDIDGIGWFGDGLIGLDRVSNSLISIDPVTADVTTLLAVEPIVGGIGGMVLTGDFAYFGTAGTGNETAPGSNELYSFDPKTGLHDPIGVFTISGEAIEGNGIAGLAMVPEPATIMFLVVGGVGLIARHSRRR